MQVCEEGHTRIIYGDSVTTIPVCSAKVDITEMTAKMLKLKNELADLQTLMNL